MSKESYFAQYQSPNIVIIPNTVLCYPPSPKRQKVEVPEQNKSPQQVDISFLDDFNIDEIVECLNNCESIGNLKELNNKGVIEDDKTSFISNNEEVIVLSEENLTNNTKSNDYSEDNERKLGKNDLDTEDVQNITISLDNDHSESKMEDVVEQIFDSDIKIDVKDAIESVENNLQLNQDVINNNRIEKNIVETEHLVVEINDFKESDCRFSVDKINIKDLDNKNFKNTKLLEEIKNESTTSIINNTDSDNNLNISPKLKDIENLKETINSYNSEQIVLKSQSYSSKTIPLLKSVIQCKSDTLTSKLLEKRMYNYLHAEYCVEYVVHYGKFSKIFKCKDSMGTHYAVKMLKQCSDRYIRGIKKEEMLLDIQADIPQENLFCVYFINSFSLNGYWCFLMDFHPKNLKQAIEESERPFHIDSVQDLARQLVAAVTLLRSRNIIHSDIKPSHILLNSSHTTLKLCGFDNSYYIASANIAPNIGTVHYRPPEIILGHSAGFSIDVWTTALVLYEMTTGHKLFHGFNDRGILYKQMITLGSIPPKMLYESQYKSKYFFNGQIFKKKCTFKGQNMLFQNMFSNHKFIKSDKLWKTLYGSYYHYWGSIRSKTEKNKDIQKIKSFINLLDKMLVISPNNRITIEFVYANPFIYEMFAL